MDCLYKKMPLNMLLNRLKGKLVNSSYFPNIPSILVPLEAMPSEMPSNYYNNTNRNTIPL